ncbi:FAD-dependent oxidoreductase [Spirochaetota bacterium]
MKKIKFLLNDEIVEVDAGTNILEAAKSKGIFIPTLCHNKELEPISYCYICVVEVEGKDDLVPSCSTEVTEGMKVWTSTEKVKETRRTCIELLLSDHLGDCLGPCMTACPAGIDIPGFIKHIAAGENRKSLELIKRNMPFPGVLGRVCKRPCEDACRRQLVEEPIAICNLKRFAADEISGSGDEYLPKKSSGTGKKIAVIGAGPAGMSAAYYLQILGHSCTVFDKNDAPGGMLRFGIPRFRLPVSVIDNEAAVLKKMGIEFKYNTNIGSDIELDELRNEFDAVFLGLGAEDALPLGVEGDDAEGIVSGIYFLRDHNRTLNNKGLKGQNVAVIGGGDVAIDAARAARRMGAASVNMYCLEKSDELPASDLEIEEAKTEGIGFNYELGVKSIQSKNNKLSGIEFMRCTSVFDPDGYFCPAYDETDKSQFDCETVIVAIGQVVKPLLAKGVGKTDKGLIVSNNLTFQTNLKDVFSGGDCVSGPGSAVEAVAAGRKAAVAMDQYVMGKDVVGEPVEYNSSMGALDDVSSKVVEKFDKKSREVVPTIKEDARQKSFDEVELGFKPESALAEAERCMECGCRDAHECKLREYSQCFGSDDELYAGESREYDLDDSHPHILYAAHKCIQCRTCVRITEELLGTSAMKVVGRGFSSRIRPNPDGKMESVNSEGLSKIVNNCPVGALTFKEDSVQTLNPVFKRPEVKC